METFTLKHPIEHKGVKYETLEARRPTVRDLRMFSKNMDKDLWGALGGVLADLCKVEPAIFELMDLEDFVPMKAWFERFLRPIINSSEESTGV